MNWSPSSERVLGRPGRTISSPFQFAARQERFFCLNSTTLTTELPHMTTEGRRAFFWRFGCSTKVLTMSGKKSPSRGGYFSRNCQCLWGIAIGIYSCAAGISQIGTVASIVPNWRRTPIVETTALRVILIGIYPASSPRLHGVVGESVDMIRLVAKRPILQLYRPRPLILDDYVLISFIGCNPIIENKGNLDIRRACRGCFGFRGSWRFCRSIGGCWGF